MRNSTFKTETPNIDRSACPGRTDSKGRERHGAVNDYRRYGCRCPDAVEDKRIYDKRQRQGRLEPGMTPALGTARRLQALAVIGYNIHDLAPHLGVSPDRISLMRGLKYPTIVASRAREVKALFDRLEMQPRIGPATKITRSRALRRGWAPPFAWDETTIDNPAARPNLGPEINAAVDTWEAALAGTLPTENLGRQPYESYKAIREAAIVYLTEVCRWNSPQIETLLGINGRMVQRDRETATRAGMTFWYRVEPDKLESVVNPGMLHPARRAARAASDTSKQVAA